jgi:hypothetical protein
LKLEVPAASKHRARPFFRTDAVHPPAALLEPLDASLDGRKHQGVVTRCPPEPNGYLHLGHAKSVAKSG